MIKKYLLLLCVGFAINCSAQEVKKNLQKLPIVDVKTPDGNTVSTSKFTNNGKPMIISFWATWCKPCVTELTTIAETYADLQKETGVKLIAVSIDDSRNMPKVGPFVNGKDWDYEVYVDPNADLKRAMNVNNVPQTFLINGNGEIVWQHTSYAPGDELKLFENLRKLIAGKEITAE